MSKCASREINYVYLSGPISATWVDDPYSTPRLGLENVRQLTKYAGILRKMGYKVYNPVEHNLQPPQNTWWDYIDVAESVLKEVDGIILIPGWEKSRGSLHEVRYASQLGLTCYVIKIHGYSGAFSIYDIGYNSYACPIPIKTYIPNEASTPNTKETICQEADRLVAHDRQQLYGPPKDNLTQIGKLWAEVLSMESIPPEKVALCMIQLKVARELHCHKRDNAVDLAGYAKMLEMCYE